MSLQLALTKLNTYEDNKVFYKISCSHDIKIKDYILVIDKILGEFTCPIGIYIKYKIDIDDNGNMGIYFIKKREEYHINSGIPTSFDPYQQNKGFNF